MRRREMAGRAVVLRVIAGDPIELVWREIGLPVFKLERWREQAEAAWRER